jgi:ribonuclease HI
MNKYSLFTDASLNPMLKIGVGGYLIVPESLIKTPSNRINIKELKEMLVLKRFEDTSSTKLEVQTVLWALEEYCIRSAGSDPGRLHMYSDSQCVEGLLQRRARLESNGFHSRGGSRLLKNASLYRQYYEFHDRLQFDVTKVAGHTPSRSRNTIERIFSVIDQKVRKEVKRWVARLEGRGQK